MKTVKINSFIIRANGPVFVIAEAGVNHNGELKLAKKLVDAAKSAGADAVKFQTFIAEDLVTAAAPKANYQKKLTGRESQLDMLKKLQLSESDFVSLKNYCRKVKIEFLSTPFDEKSADFLQKLGMAAFKISSGDLNNLPFLIKIAKFRKPVILSTGMSTLSEVKEACKAVASAGNRQLTLLHCTSNYPAPFEDVHLNAMKTLADECKVPIGYSDHTPGIEVAIAAVAMGACVIEKHLTLDHKLSGPDHKASLELDDFKMMVQAIRHVEKAKGLAKKVPMKSELETKTVARKSIVAAIEIPKGTTLTPQMLTVKRPGTGLEPKLINRLTGKRTTMKLNKDQLLSWDCVR